MPGKRNLVVDEILSSLLEGTDLLLEWMENPHAQRRRIRGVLTNEEWTELFGDQRKKAALRRLKKKKWLEDSQKGNVVTFELSQEAVVEHIGSVIQKKDCLAGKSETIVSFDFPEVSRKARLMWRRLLKKLGFTRAQLSVWTTAKDVGREIQSLAQSLGISDWINVYKAEKLN